MKIIAFITEAVVIREILGHLGEPISPPRLLPARGPPLWEMLSVEPDEIDSQAQPAIEDNYDVIDYAIARSLRSPLFLYDFSQHKAPSNRFDTWDLSPLWP